MTWSCLAALTLVSLAGPGLPSNVVVVVYASLVTLGLGARENLNLLRTCASNGGSTRYLRTDKWVPACHARVGTSSVGTILKLKSIIVESCHVRLQLSDVSMLPRPSSHHGLVDTRAFLPAMRWSGVVRRPRRGEWSQ